MKTTIKIDNKHKFKIDTCNNWLRIYRDTFGHDILPDIIPLFDAALEMIAGEMTTEDKDVVDIIEEKTMEMEMVTVDNIIWALAKNADDELPDPEEWDRQHDVWYLEEIVPQVVSALAKTYVTTKKLKLLKEGWEMRRSQLIQSLSPESTED